MAIALLRHLTADVTRVVLDTADVRADKGANTQVRSQWTEASQVPRGTSCRTRRAEAHDRRSPHETRPPPRPALQTPVPTRRSARCRGCPASADSPPLRAQSPQLPRISRTRRCPVLLQETRPPHHIGHGLTPVHVARVCVFAALLARIRAESRTARDRSTRFRSSRSRRTF